MKESAAHAGFNANTSGVYTIAATPFHPDGRIAIASIDRVTDSSC